MERRNDNWELILSAFPRAGSDNHQKTDKDFQGSLKIDDLMTPLVGSLPFDDILLVSQEGTIVYQSKKTGPQFMTLSALLQSQITETAPAKSAAEKQAGGAGPAKTEPKTKPETRGGPIDENADPSWRARSMHMTEVMLAGTKYKLFLQPVLVSTFIDAATEEEPASEWVLAGMKSSASVDWEALSLSYTFFIWFTFLFFVIWASYKVLKIIFMNQREHLHLRELGSLGLSLVLLAAVLTFSLLQLDFHLNDDTEAQLHRVGGTLSKNIHDELRQMADQLTEWCGVAANGKDNLGDDLGKVARNGKPGSKDPQEVIRNMNAEGKPLARADIESTPEPTKYPYVNNAFWTDDDGHQIVKWSTIQYVTPMIDVSQLPIYGQAASYLEGNKSAFHFVSIMPPNKLEYLATLGMNTSVCTNERLKDTIPDDIAEGSAFLTAQPLSLIDPILPYGFSFALVDQTGAVVFHSDKSRNGRENFLVESDGNQELYAAIFGQGSRRAMSIKYRGKDYRALVLPVWGVSQAPWSLIVFRDLSSVRTLNLQVMTLAATLLFLILGLPVVIIAIWRAARRPRFAPEWLWPNRDRLRTYVYLLFLYGSLIGLFVLAVSWASTEQVVMACVVFPYAAILLTVWCVRATAPAVGLHRGRKPGLLSAAAAASAGVLLVAAAAYRKGFLIGAAPLLERPRQYLNALVDRWSSDEPHADGRRRRESFAYRKCYLGAVLLLLVFLGVFIPMALFRASLNVERRLAIKQSQRHLATELAERWRRVVAEKTKEQMSEAAWCAYQQKPGCTEAGSPWAWIASDVVGPDGKLPVEGHKVVSNELYSAAFRRLLYWSQHDYNESAAETLGVLDDRGHGVDWAWDDEESTISLRWHGAHPSPLGDSGHGDPFAAHDDLVLRTVVPGIPLAGCGHVRGHGRRAAAGHGRDLMGARVEGVPVRRGPVENDRGAAGGRITTGGEECIDSPAAGLEVGIGRGQADSRCGGTRDRSEMGRNAESGEHPAQAPDRDPAIRIHGERSGTRSSERGAPRSGVEAERRAVRGGDDRAGIDRGLPAEISGSGGDRSARRAFLLAGAVRGSGAGPDLERVRPHGGSLAAGSATGEGSAIGSGTVGGHHRYRNTGARRWVLPDDLERMHQGPEIRAFATGGRRAVESDEWESDPATGSKGTDHEGSAVPDHERELPAVPGVGHAPVAESGVAE